MADLMPARTPAARRNPVACYEYFDANRNLLYQVLRYAPKSFSQRRPGPKGRWIWKLDGTPRVLYRLPELLAADRLVPVYIPEGEKDVDRLTAQGLIATTNPNGAGKWHADYNQYLKGRKVVLLPDNDSPGRAHAEAVAASLHGIAESVQILPLPDLPEKGDVSDWLDAGHSGQDLVKLVAGCPLWKPATPDSTQPELQGKPLLFGDAEPWPVPVDGTLLLNELLAVFTHYVVLPPGAAVALALWVIFSHAHEAFSVSPILGLNSPTKRSGKTTTLTILHGLVPRSLMASNVTSAVLFRSIEKFVPTLLIDEADTFLRDNEELRGILNSGHVRSSAAAVRSVGDQHEPRAFSTFCPKAIALIGKLHETLEDRAILIALKRKAPGEKVERLRLDRIDQELRPFLQRASRWGKDHLDVLRSADPVVPEGLHDRAADNWRPLLAIAEACGGLWPDEARLAAVRLAGGSSESDNTLAIQLLADFKEIFAGRNADKIASDEVTKELHKLEERPWADFRNGKPISKAQVARLLRPFEITPKQLWIDKDNSRGYVLADFEDSFARYRP
jgi:hypothetical protein